MDSKKQTIGIMPFGEIPEIVPKIIAGNIIAYLNLLAEIIPPAENPDYALNGKRLQYDAGTILMNLESSCLNNYEKVIGVFDVDLFVPIFSYVFGEAKQGGKYALVSLFRLKNNPDGSITPSSIFYERAAKVALHELGHLYNLFHCEDKRCLMHFSGGLEDLDETPLYFCRYCTAFFKDALLR
ncbi:MAG: archaemetzincin family Zn-dependent metalloprotease [Deltaproteobacteria bacterium]|nr:archaemetzincin family Zn-dependent metalloprotease [Deltaproteobacteria bacterium]MBW2180822.1 archaemetzincin family Zn-dependent metalloprotease [Deltaproteobacteria bacterium]